MIKTVSILCLLCLLTTKLLCAQTPEPVQAQATYHFTHIRDTTDRAHPYTEDLLLLLGRNASACTSIDARLQQENFVKQITNQAKTAPDPNHINLNIPGQRPVSDEYYQFLATRKLITKHKLVNNYLVEEPLPAISWKISTDTLSISRLHCQKATAHFKGRDYVAWFCADLPFRSGPWKLHGLPGLIVQASDTKKEVIFEFAGFEQISNQKVTVKLPEDAIYSTQKEFERLQQVAKTNPSALSKIAGKTSGSPLDAIDPSKISSMNVSRADFGFSKKVNNPVELPEK
ncbi:MAG: GLPGLI family protein [Sphingobacteriaceae bacterium]|nr:MAG: GLPGLI family protein [Sphingobacteriaceae bacterium]